MKKLIVAAAIAALAVAPAGAVAKPNQADKENAAQACKAERDALGADAFKEKYGSNKNGKNAFGKCVKGGAKDEEVDREEAKEDAAKDCKAEREADPVAFKEKYGSNKNGKNAHGKCVSQTVKADADDEGVE